VICDLVDRMWAHKNKIVSGFRYHPWVWFLAIPWPE
jgi:hypothetical protein